MFHNSERGFIDFRADQRRPPGPQRNDAFSRESESPAKPVVPSSLTEAMKRAEMMAARIETRYERSRSQRRDRRSRSGSRPRGSSVHRSGNYRSRDKSRGRSRSRRRSSRSPIGDRYNAKTSGRPRSDSVGGRQLAERDRSPGSYRRNGRMSRFDQPERRPRSRSRSVRSPGKRRTPPRTSPFNEFLPDHPGRGEGPVLGGALSRFEAPPSPKRDSLSPPVSIGASSAVKDPGKGGNLKSQHKHAALEASTASNKVFSRRIFTGEELYEGISNDSMSEETSKKFSGAMLFRPIQPDGHRRSECDGPTRRKRAESPVNSIFPDVAPLDQRSTSSAGRHHSREVVDRRGGPPDALRTGDPLIESASPVPNRLDKGQRLTPAEERYLEIVKLRENIRRVEQNIVTEASRKSRRELDPKGSFAGEPGRLNQTHLERGDADRGTWEPSSLSGNRVGIVSPLQSSYRSERRDQWRSLDDANPLGQPPAKRLNVSTGEYRQTPPLPASGRMHFPSDSSFQGVDQATHREQAVRLPSLYGGEDEEYPYGFRQQPQRVSPVKQLSIPGILTRDTSSQATNSSLPSIPNEATLREDWLREIDDLKRQLREKEEIAKEYRNRSLSLRETQATRPLSSRSNQDFNEGGFRPNEHGPGLRRDLEARVSTRPLSDQLVRRSPGERRSPARTPQRRRSRSPTPVCTKRPQSPAYRRRSRSPYSRRSPITQRDPYDERTHERSAYVKAMEGYQPPRHEMPPVPHAAPSMATTSFQGQSSYLPTAMASSLMSHERGNVASFQYNADYYSQVQPSQQGSFYPYGNAYATSDHMMGYSHSGVPMGLQSEAGSVSAKGISVAASDGSDIYDCPGERTNLKTLTGTSHGKKPKKKGNEGESSIESRMNPPAFAEIDVGLQPVDMDLEDEDEAVGEVVQSDKEQQAAIRNRPEEKYAQEIESYLRLTNEKDAEKERLSILKQEMSRISKLQADLLRLRKSSPEDGQVARQLANTGKLYEEAKKRATTVGKQIDGLGQEIFKIPQKIKLLAMEHEDKFRDKIETIRKAVKEKVQAAAVGGGSQKKDIRFKYVDRGEFFCSNCRTEYRSIPSFLGHLHTELHIANSNQAIEKPWANLESTTKISPPSGATCNVPAKGGQFIMGITGFYCKICRDIFPDSVTAEKHVLSEDHNLKYKEYIGMNPFYERRVQLEKETILHSIAKAIAPRQTKTASNEEGSRDSNAKASKSSRSECEDQKSVSKSPTATNSHSTDVHEHRGDAKSDRDRASPSERRGHRSHRSRSRGADSEHSSRNHSSKRDQTVRSGDNIGESASNKSVLKSTDVSEREKGTRGSNRQSSHYDSQKPCNSTKELSGSSSPRRISTAENRKHLQQNQKVGGIRLKLLKSTGGTAKPLIIGKAPFKRKLSNNKDNLDSTKEHPVIVGNHTSNEETDFSSCGVPPIPPGEDEAPPTVGPFPHSEEVEPPPPGDIPCSSEATNWIPSYSSWEHSASDAFVVEVEGEPEDEELEEY